MAEDFFGAIGKKFAKAAHSAADKTSSLMETTKINSRISGEQKEIDKLFQQIGESILERVAAGEIQLSDRENLIQEEIGVHRKRIKELRKMLASVKGMKICPACEGIIALDVAFCPKCGAPTPVPETEEVMAEEIVFEDEDISDGDMEVNEGMEVPEDFLEETIFVEEPEVTEETEAKEEAKEVTAEEAEEETVEEAKEVTIEEAGEEPKEEKTEEPKEEIKEEAKE